LVREAGQATGATVTHTIATTVTGAAVYAADLGLVDIPEGAVVLTASVTDAAGNAASLDLPVSVQSTAPTVIVTTPAHPGDACGACAGTAMCGDGMCWHRWNLGYASQSGTFTLNT